jgi:hypothetical protein
MIGRGRCADSSLTEQNLERDGPHEEGWHLDVVDT